MTMHGRCVRLAILVLASLATTAFAQGTDVGRYVVVVEDTEAKIANGTVGTVHRGTVFVVQQVNDRWLWPNLGRPGWIPASAVLPLDQARERFDNDLRRDSRDAQAYWGRGQIHSVKRDWDAAIDEFDEVIRLAPNAHLGYLSRGLCRFESGQLETALQDFDRAAELAPAEAAVFQLRKLVHAARGDWKPALADADRAVTLGPKDARGFNGRAWLRATCPDAEFRDGKLAVADAEVACRLTSHSNFKCLGTLAAAHAEAGDFEQAVRWQTKALSLAPSSYRESFAARLKQYESDQPYRAARGGDPLSFCKDRASRTCRLCGSRIKPTLRGVAGGYPLHPDS